MRLTVFTALVEGAPTFRAHDSFSAVDMGVPVGTLVGRAKCLAALLFLALVVFALHVLGVLDQRVTVGAFDRVAVVRALLLGSGIVAGGKEGERLFSRV